MKRIALGRISTIVATVVVAAGLAASASAAPSGSCPNIKQGNFLAAPNVAAGFTTVGNVSTYWFASLTDENSKAGVPGLVKYCVYPDPSAVPIDNTVAAEGANGDPWIYGADASNFMFGRPSGNKSNIPLDGETVTMGTATWGTAAPTNQTILLHIADSTVCKALYGGNPSTCFVLPRPGPICNVASPNATGAAYNSIPSDAVNCGPPSLGFEATSTREFGDKVGLVGSGALESLTVLFNSYACDLQPTWYTAGCQSTTGKTFEHEITAHIYAVNDSTTPPTPGMLLATATKTFTIPYRPSADNLLCTGEYTGGWFNTVSQKCEFSAKVLLTFTDTDWDASPTLSDNVIWTVAFNTSHYGDPPLGVKDCSSTDVGCPYDSLNVGTMKFPGAPYAGTDVDPNGAFINSTWAGVYCDAGGTGILRESTNNLNTCWLGYTPLATIRVK